MGYKKVKSYGEDALKFGKYRLIFVQDDTNSMLFKRGTVVVFCDGYGYGAHKKNELRKISFDLEKRDITYESRNINKKRFHKFVLQNVTNKEFFDYYRRHIEKMFGILYEVEPNKDRTVFLLKKRTESIAPSNKEED